MWYHAPGSRRHPLEDIGDEWEQLSEQPRPRLGRRESEPHNDEVTYLMLVLLANFPEHRLLRELHHYLPDTTQPGTIINIEFDLSMILNWQLDKKLTSYDASIHGHVPSLAINILSRSTWRKDMLDHLSSVKAARIPVYILFSPYNVCIQEFSPPFLRIYKRGKDGEYHHSDTRELAIDTGKVVPRHIVDPGLGVPFRVGLGKTGDEVLGSGPCYRLHVFDKTRDVVLLTRDEQEVQRAEQEKQRAEQEKQRAEHAETMIQRYRERFGEL